MKNKIIWLAALTLLVVHFIACDEDKDEFTAGNYHYVGSDLDGQEVTEGELHIVVNDSVIEGEKNIRIVSMNAQDVQDTGTGLIHGRISSEGMIEIYLMMSQGPYMLIRGKFDNGKLRGNRYHAIEIAEISIGTFTAEKMH